MENNVKKCKYCGTEMEMTSKICPNCKKRQKLAWWQIVLIVIGVLVVISMFSGSSETENNTNNPSAPSGSVENVGNTEQKPKEEKDTYVVGETFNDGRMSIAYTAANDNFTGYSQYATVKPGYKVVSASFEFENVSTVDQLASSFDFTCYADGYDCESFWSVDDSSFSANLSAGKKTKGNVYFEVPQDAAQIVIEYENNIWTANKVKFIVK